MVVTGCPSLTCSRCFRLVCCICLWLETLARARIMMAASLVPQRVRAALVHHQQAAGGRESNDLLGCRERLCALLQGCGFRVPRVMGRGQLKRRSVIQREDEIVVLPALGGISLLPALLP